MSCFPCRRGTPKRDNAALISATSSDEKIADVGGGEMSNGHPVKSSSGYSSLNGLTVNPDKGAVLTADVFHDNAAAIPMVDDKAAGLLDIRLTHRPPSMDVPRAVAIGQRSSVPYVAHANGERNVYDLMLEDSLKTCELLQKNLDTFITEVKTSSKEATPEPPVVVDP